MSTNRDRQQGRPPVVGIAGGVCSGKSTVARIMSEEGFELIDADRIGHEVLKRDDIKREVREAFGADVLDERGEVDRRKLGRKAFTCKPCLHALNQIVHPPILAQIDRRIRAAQRPVVLDAALLIEKGLQRKYCDALIFVDAPEELRAERAVAHRGWEPGQVQKRDSAQMPPRLKKRRADVVIENAGSLEELERTVRRTAEELRRRLSGSPATEAQ